MNERDFPFIVELHLLPRGFGKVRARIEAFHKTHGLLSRKGRRQRREDQDFVRWCFADAETAEAFRAQFGGKRLGVKSKEPFAALSAEDRGNLAKVIAEYEKRGPEVFRRLAESEPTFYLRLAACIDPKGVSITLEDTIIEHGLATHRESSMK